MKNSILLLLFALSIMSFSHSQEKKTIREVIKESDRQNAKREAIINKEIDSINIQFSNTALRDKLNSDLNSIQSIRTSYAKSKELNLNKNEIIELVDRMLYAAKSFYNDKNYILFSFSNGIVALSVLSEKIINNKTVAIVNYHSGTISEKSKINIAILLTFNDKMEELLSKK
jgi:hypothetical protein